MSNPNSGVGRIEHLGMPRSNDSVRDPEMPPLEDAQPSDPIATKLDRIMPAIAKLETRLDENDRWAADTRLPPDPPYGMPLGWQSDYVPQKSAAPAIRGAQPSTVPEVFAPP